MEVFNVKKLEKQANSYEKKFVKSISKVLDFNRKKLVKWARNLDSQVSKSEQEDLRLLNGLFQELNYEFVIPNDQDFFDAIRDIALEELKSNVKPLNSIIFDLVNTQFTKEEVESVLNNLQAELSATIKEVDFQNLRNLLTKRVLEGWDYTTVVNKFLSELAFEDEKRAMRIARTETTRIVSELDSMLFNKLGIKNIKISIANSACDICREKAKFIYQTGDRIVPIHPYCRCRIIAVIPESWTT